MLRLAKVVVSAVAAAFALSAQPQKIPHGTVDLIKSAESVEPGGSARVGLLFRLEPGWHIYWQNPGDSGQAPRLTWQLPAGWQAGEIEWPAPKRLPVGPLLDYGYEGTVLLPVTLQAASDARANTTQSVLLNLRVLVCKETCMPGKAALHLQLPVRANAPTVIQSNQRSFNEAQAALPKQLPAGWKVSAEQKAEAISVTVTGAPAASVASFIPAQPHQIENAAPQHLSSQPDGFDLRLKPATQQAGPIEKLAGLLVIEDGDLTKAYRVDAPVRLLAAEDAATKTGAPLSLPKTGGTSLPAILLFAFAGGLILNLMPCVFPVLSLKVLSLLDQSHGDRATIRISAGVYTAGVLASFWVLVAVLLILRAAGRSLGWGFQLQSPGFVAFLICLLFILGLSLLGTFEIGTSLMGAGSSLTQRGRYSSSFFTGVLATVVATPCTAPFMGAAVGFALGQTALVCVLVFTVMAIGLAAPFLLLSLAPGLARLLPRPGAWMETLKQALSFPVFATVIWLLWVLGQQAGINDVAMLLLAMLTLSVAGWMAGRWAQSRVAVSLAALIGLGAVIWSCAAVTAMRENSVHAENIAAGGLSWEPFSPEKLADYRAQGKPVLIDFTAAWCLTCQVNDRVVFHSPEVERHLKGSPLILMRADWTSYDPRITQLLASYGRSGIPLYVVYGSGPNAAPVTLPDGVLTPSVFLSKLQTLNL